MKGHLTMSRKELKRKSVLEHVSGGQLNLRQASGQLSLSYRQTLRIYQRYKQEGDEGLVHRSRGRSSNRRYPAAFREKVLSRYRNRYKEHDLGPTLAAEKLAAEGLAVDHETLRRWLLEEGDWSKRRKRRKHRCQRARRSRFGELVQMDGSHHPWFGEEHEKACLMNMVDDATSATLSRMDHQETTVAAMLTLWRWIDRYGIPQALYTDRKNVYVTGRLPTLEEQLRGEEPLTAFGKACKKLGIEIITAHSPQAKGRVERSNGVYQDRLVKELALRRISTCESADRLLREGFCDELNERFAQPPLEAEDCHCPLPAGLNLEDIFCFEEYRVLANDWTLRHENHYYQVLEENRPLPRPGDRILIRTHLDGGMKLIFREKELAYHRLTPRQLNRQKRKEERGAAAVSVTDAGKKSAAHKPDCTHPWRQGCSLMKNETVR